MREHAFWDFWVRRYAQVNIALGVVATLTALAML